jgi:hypothetical protein
MADDDRQWDDPCVTYKKLRACYLRLISGTQESEVEYLQLGIQRRVKYSIASLNDLKQAMMQAQSECAALTGSPDPGRRFAITAGSRRPRSSPWRFR